MSRFAPLSVCAALLLTPLAPAAPNLAGKNTPLKPLVSGLKGPTSACVWGGRLYVTCAGELGKDGDGSVVLIREGKATPFAAGLDDPRGAVAWHNGLFVADRDRVLRIDSKGKATVHAEAKAFPAPPKSLTDLEVDGAGTVYASDSGGAIYRIGRTFAFGKPGPLRVTLVADGKKNKAIKSPTALRWASEAHLRVLDRGGELLRLKLPQGTSEKVAGGLGGGGGVTFDYHGRLYVTDTAGGKVHVRGRPEQKPVLLAGGFEAPADPCLAPDRASILVPDTKAGTLTAVPCTVPGQEIDESPLPVEVVPALTEVEWTDWVNETPTGLPIPLRPILLTHAGDGTHRTFVATQRGVVHILPKGGKGKTKVFLDVQKLVKYSDATNEEGFLGLAFSPSYKDDGTFYVYYTPRRIKSANVVARYKVSKDDPDRADPKSEEILLTLKKPFWNHDGGTIIFGPDKMLYIAVGDGGAADDPFKNAQNLNSLLGKVLRIDVTKKDKGLAYAIPKDNPFAGREGARGEVWAYGLRNVWRMAFDRKTGKLWAADVGQNLWEEINLITKGGNYGWRPRESLHPFKLDGVGPNKGMVDPIWEYHHDVGKSVTGGHVYRGKKVPALEGKYLYADYVSGHVWALTYDEKKKRVTGHHLLRKPGKFEVMSFGEDEAGEAYLMMTSTTGKGIYTFRTRKVTR